jgi:hypothetical protein
MVAAVTAVAVPVAAVRPGTAQASTAQPDTAPQWNQVGKEATMHQNRPPPDNDPPGQRPAPVAAAMASPPYGPAARQQARHLEKAGGWSGGERLRFPWSRLRVTVAEMNSATGGLPEPQAPRIYPTIAAAEPAATP